MAKIKTESTAAQKEIVKLKDQLHLSKENIAKERAERGSRARQKEGSPKDEVGSKRFRQQTKQAKALKPRPSPTGDMSDATMKRIILSVILKRLMPRQSLQQSVQMDIEPKPVMGRASITRTHQRLIDLAIDSLEDDEHV